MYKCTLSWYFCSEEGRRRLSALLTCFVHWFFLSLCAIQLASQLYDDLAPIALPSLSSSSRTGSASSIAASDDRDSEALQALKVKFKKVQALCKEEMARRKQLETVTETLVHNISVLYKTAREELDRMRAFNVSLLAQQASQQSNSQGMQQKPETEQAGSNSGTCRNCSEQAGGSSKRWKASHDNDLTPLVSSSPSCRCHCYCSPAASTGLFSAWPMLDVTPSILGVLAHKYEGNSSSLAPSPPHSLAIVAAAGGEGLVLVGDQHGSDRPSGDNKWEDTKQTRSGSSSSSKNDSKTVTAFTRRQQENQKHKRYSFAIN